jgi:hypothetical protein
MKKLLPLTLALSVLATFSGLATAATTIKSSKSNASDPVAADKASPKLLTGKVTEVNNQAKTFTVMAKGKAVVFSAAKLSKLPTVGEIVDITYTQTTPGGPLEAINLNSSRSNVD